MNPQSVCKQVREGRPSGDDRLEQRVDGDTWLTPRWILDRLGWFNLDPCGSSVNPGWTGAPDTILPPDDGLKEAWHGRVFMNPPFSRTKDWLQKHSIHRNGISLVPASVESTVWRKYVWPHANAILLLSGRTKFCNPDGSTTTGRPLRSIALIAWTGFDAQVLVKCGLAGVLIRHWDQC